MRDYNQIKFKSPRKVKDHPLIVKEDEKKEAGSGSATGSSSTTQTAPSTPPVPARKQQPYQQYQQQQQTSPHQLVRTSSPPMSAQDALAVRKEGAEATIVRLRSALEESSHKDTTAKAALAKSDAVILELKSSVRQLKRQLEKVQQEKEELERQQAAGAGGGPYYPSNNTVNTDASLDARIGELQVQLDRAHAQILTADMVRKELEDTLEAEQYTWELRVQDQERHIQELQQDCTTLVADLESVKKQWKESDANWQKQVDELKAKLQLAQSEAANWRSAPANDDESARLKEKLRSLESERAELQGCLDEALKELEAVDAELQGDPVQQLREENERLQQALDDAAKVGGAGGDMSSLTEPLQHLYRLLLEREGPEANVSRTPREPRALVAAIQAHIDASPPPNANLQQTRQQVRALEAQLSVYKGDLQAREETTAELRASLKEAVSLLKPLQDAVAKADQEKQSLLRQIEDLKSSSTNSVDGDQVKGMQTELALKEKEIDRLREEVQTLEHALTRAKAMAASSAAAMATSPESSVDSATRARKLRQKRADEDQIRQMLKDAQSRFHNLHEENQEATARNINLQNRLDEENSELLQDLKDELKIARGELSAKEVQMRQLEKELETERYKRGNLGEDDAVALREARSRVEFLERKLDSITSELKSKRESERALNASLKEALNLLRPMQTHLEEAEREKREMAKELMVLKRRGGGVSRSGGVNSDGDNQHVRELEFAVQQLEKENSQLHDALEDMSQSINASHLSGNTNLSAKNEAKLREDLVEMKSRYEVTQSRLEDAFVENHTLVEALQKREKEEKEMVEELHVLRQKLKQSQAELERTRSRSFGNSSTYSGHSQERRERPKTPEQMLASRERMERPRTPDPNINVYGTARSPHSGQRRTPTYWE